MSVPSQHPPATDELPGAMLNELQFYPRKALVHGCEMGGYDPINYPIKPVLDHMTSASATLAARKLPNPRHGVELQASEICPRNFIIFDQADNGSRIMFHPALAHKLPSLDLSPIYNQVNVGSKESSFKEDTRDIDALLSLEENEEDEEEVSTGRTFGNYRSSSPDSSSTTGSSDTTCTSSWSWKQKPFRSKCGTKRRQQRMQKVVKALRGIIPGGDRMGTIAILDEAVKYLKSLKVEAKKLGIGKYK